MGGTVSQGALYCSCNLSPLLMLMFRLSIAVGTYSLVHFNYKCENALLNVWLEALYVTRGHEFCYLQHTNKYFFLEPLDEEVCYFPCEISSSHGGEYDVQSCLLGCTAV
jgi:hypothetical protein